MSMTNKELYEDYHKEDTTQATKDSHLKFLKQRASYGNRDAAFYADKIERCNKQPVCPH